MEPHGFPIFSFHYLEEPTVRDNAAHSANTVCRSSIQSGAFHSQYIAMLNRLSVREWYTARGSASVLIANSFDIFTQDEQKNFLQKYAVLSKDEAPMVRRLAAKYLGTLVTKYAAEKGLSFLQDGDALHTTLLPLFDDFASNKQPDCVTLQTVHNCIALGDALSSILTIDKKMDPSGSQSKLLSDDGKKASVLIGERILPLVISLVDASSWRVRWTAASRYSDIVTTFLPFAATLPMLIPAYETLLGDVEPEVCFVLIL
jgi:serine/threonine-protein phosphatase 2A regulatory subunit A